MTTYTPILGAADWASNEASPWLTENAFKRTVEAMARGGIIADRDLSAPPGACADGACYLIKAAGTGLWASHDNQLAISIGANAVGGWLYIIVAVEGVELYIQDENIKIRWNGAAWITIATSSADLDGLTDVDLSGGLGDGYVLTYDLSNGYWYAAPSASVGGGLLAANNLSDVANAGTARTNLGLVPGTDVQAYSAILANIVASTYDAAIKPMETLVIAVGDETTAITTGTAKVTFRMPYAFTVTAVRASLTTVSSSGLPTVDINESGTTILSTKLTIDASEKTSTTAATAAVISDPNLADDAEITIDIDTAGTGATGLKVYIIGHRA